MQHLSIFLLSCLLVSTPAPGMYAMETDPLLEAHCHRVQIEQPQLDCVIVPAHHKHRCCNSFKQIVKRPDKERLRLVATGALIADVMGGLCIGLLGDSVGIAFGTLFLSFGLCFKCCGGYKLWENCRKTIQHNKFIAQANNRLQAAQTKDRIPVAFPLNEMKQLRKYASTGNIAQIEDMITNIDVLSIEPQINLTQREITRQTQRLSMLLYCLRKLPRDLRYKIVAQRPELIHDQQMFNHTLPHAWSDGQLATWLHKFPLQWFNGYYRLKCGKEYKVDFSRTVAQAATDIRMNILLAFLPHEIREQFTLAELHEMQESIFNQYKNKITYEPLPEV